MLGSRMAPGGAPGRMGDYVFSQEGMSRDSLNCSFLSEFRCVAGLEQIMNQLMENGSKPVPLAETEIDRLPRDKLRATRMSPILVFEIRQLMLSITTRSFTWKRLSNLSRYVC